MRQSKGSPERELHSNTGLLKKMEKSQKNQPNPTSKRTRGTTTTKAWNEQKEGNNQDQR